MEKAYLITESTDLSGLKNRTDIDRYYFWDAYCEHNLFYFLDNAAFVKDILLLSKPLTLTTPIISNKNIGRLLSFIEEHQNLEGFEVVVNDYGVFHVMKEGFPHIRLIWGNFLSGQNKDPFLKIFKDKEIHRRLSIDNDFYETFFHNEGIDCVEIYNAFQWLELDKDYGLVLYHPYVVYSVNRYCSTNLVSENKNYLTVVEECSGCAGKKPPNLHMDLKMKGESSKNFLRWNKQFYENNDMIQDDRIRRIVYNYDLVW